MAGNESFEVVPVAHVVGGRSEPTDDYWGGTRAIVRIDDSRFTADATVGLEEFSHLEVVFRFHLTDPADLNLGARRPRDNPDWPAVGIFGHRNMRRLNWLGISRCRLLRVDGLDLHVEDLDAVHGTPVLDIKPWFAEMGPGARSSRHGGPWRCCGSTTRRPPPSEAGGSRTGVQTARTGKGPAPVRPARLNPSPPWSRQGG